MPRAFSQATAEQVIRVSEATIALGGKAEKQSISGYTDFPLNLTEKALLLAEDLQLIKENNGTFAPLSPLCKLLRTPQEKERAAVLRITIESFEPFQIFREELEATADASIAATRTKARLDLDCHREEIKDTLVSLATFSGALIVSHGNNYERDNKSMSNLLLELAEGSGEEAAAVYLIRCELGVGAADWVDHANVVVPLATSLRHASGGNAGREAVLHAGNAVDSFLDAYAAQCGANLQGATGINGKLDKLQNQGHLPKKLQFIGKYIGHCRNAADHGLDQDVGAAWDISDATGRNIVFVSAQFIASIYKKQSNSYEV